MKILCIGDAHLKISKFNTCIKFLDEVKEVIERESPDMVVNLGDSFHDHAVLRSEIMSIFRAHIKHITSREIPYYYIVGNHDQYQPKDNKYHALEAFKDIKLFHVIDTPTHMTLLNISMIPYIPNMDNFPKKTLPICFAHQTFIGADYGYHRPDIGVDADTISANIIIGGHIHKRQNFGKVHYVGSPFAHDANDVGQIKGLSVFDTNTYDFKFIETTLPNFISIDIDLSLVSKDSVLDIFRNIEHQKDNYIINMCGTRSDIDNLLKDSDIIELRKTSNIRVVPEYKDTKKNDRVKIKHKTMDGIIDEYVSRIYQGEIDKDILINRALDIWNKYKE